LFGAYEPGITKLFKRLVKRGMMVADVGAHVGYYTLLASKLVGPEGKVYAFEPDPRNFLLLLKNLEENDCRNVRAFRIAISSYIGTASLFSDPRDTGLSTLYANRDGEVGSARVAVTTLDDFFGTMGERPHLIKMDIEGGEIEALQGMADIVRSNPDIRVITEFFLPWFKRAGASAADFLKCVSGLGLSVSIIGEDDGHLEPANPTLLLEPKGRHGINVFLERA
jgi:FkbM family methyltransferase